VHTVTIEVSSIRKSLGSGRTGLEGRWRAYTYDEIAARDKVSLDIFWLRDESLSESDNLPDPDVLAQEIVDDLEAALEQFREITWIWERERAGPETSFTYRPIR
jgi:hypothetical protein